MVPVPKVLVGYKGSKDMLVRVFTFWFILACDCSPTNLVPVGNCGRGRGRQSARYPFGTVRGSLYAQSIAPVGLWSLDRFFLLLELCVYIFDSDGGYRGRSGSGRCDGKAWPDVTMSSLMVERKQVRTGSDSLRLYDALKL